MSTIFDWATPTNLRNNAEPVEPSDAATKAYVDAMAGGTPGGPDTAVQFNDGTGEFAGSANLTFDGANLTVAETVYASGISSSALTITSSDTELVINTNGNIDVTGAFINNLNNPAAAQDAATKAYVDSVAQGLKVLDPCLLATNAQLPAYTYDNGAAGVGATITFTDPELLNIDGDFVEVGDRVLVKNEIGAVARCNGIYVVTVAGDGVTQAVLTRASDNDDPSSFYGAYTFIQRGLTNAFTGWICSNVTTDPITIGTTPITWVQFSQAGVVAAGAGIRVSGAQVSVLTDSVTLGVNAENQVHVLDQARFVQPDIGVATGQDLSLTNYLTVGNDVTVGGTVYSGEIVAENSLSANTVNSQLATIATVETSQLVTDYITSQFDITIVALGEDADISLDTQGNVSVNNSRVVDVGAPLFPADAATKNYVDTAVINAPGNYSNANVAAYLAVNSGPITAATPSLLSSDSNVATTAFVKQVVANVQSSYGNSNVAAYLPTYSGNVQSLNITGSAFAPIITDVSSNTNAIATTNFVQRVVTSIGGYGNAQVAQYLPTYSGNIGNNIGVNVTGNLTARTIFNTADNSNNVATTAFVQAVITSTSNYGNAQVAQFLPTYSGVIGNNIGVAITGNLSAATASADTNTTQVATTAFVQRAVQSVVTYGNANVAAYLPAYSGNIGNNIGINVTGNLTATTPSTSANSTQVATTAYVNQLLQTTYYYGNANVAAYLPTYAGNLNPGNIRTNNYQFANGAPLDSFTNLTIANATVGNLVVNQSSIALGSFANALGNGVAIGVNSQTAANSVAIGSFAGNNSTSSNTVAIGAYSAQTNQSANTVAVGALAGQVNQSANAVAIGSGAGRNTQGINSIAIGAGAGANSQVANSIVINASGNILNATNSGLYVKPVRNDLGNTAQSVYFNPATNEVTYAPSPAASTYGNANVAAFLSTFTGPISANVLISNRVLVQSMPNVTSTANTVVYTASNALIDGFRLTLKALVGANCVQMADVMGTRDVGGNVGFSTYSRVSTNTQVPNINIGVGLDGGNQLIVYASGNGANVTYTYEVVEFN